MENTNAITTKPAAENVPAVQPSANPVPAELQARIDRLYTDEHLDALFMAKAEIMSKSHILPPMFHGDQYACYALQRLAFQWQTDAVLLAPGLYKVAADSPLTLDGKTVASVIDRFAPVKDHFIADEYFGEWDKILGKFELRESKKAVDQFGKPKTYKVPAWRPEDEQGLGIRLTATLTSGHKIVYELLLTQCLTRNSTLWAEDPKLQIYYRAIARFSRKYFPYILNGMYIREEFDDQNVIDVTPVEPTHDAEAEKPRRTTRAAALKEKLGVGKKSPESAEVPPVVAEVMDAANVTVEPQGQQEAELPIPPAEIVSDRLNAAIAASGAPITLAEVEMYLNSRGVCEGYGIDELDKYPENWRNRMAGDLTNLVNLAAEWITSAGK